MPGLLTEIIFVPLLGAVVILLLGKGRDGFSRVCALAVSLVDFVLSIWLWTRYRSGTHEMQFAERIPWIESLGIEYHLGIDGISILLVMITTLLMLTAGTIALGKRSHPATACRPPIGEPV